MKFVTMFLAFLNLAGTIKFYFIYDETSDIFFIPLGVLTFLSFVGFVYLTCMLAIHDDKTYKSYDDILDDL